MLPAFQNRLLFLSLLLLVFGPSALALPNPRVMRVPLLYSTGPDGSVLEVSTDSVDERNAWVVSSDRANNPTYTEPGGSPLKTMNFLECFYVTEERGNFLHLYKYETGIKDSRERLRDNAEDYGWAPKENLLLWMRCLEDAKKLSLKALPIITKSTLGSNLDAYVKAGDNLRLFRNPGLSVDNETTIQMFQFLFVFKKEGNSLLVGKGNVTFQYRIETDMLGWVSADIVQQWGDRICLEPNDMPEAVEERKLAKVKSSLFATKEQAAVWQKTGTAKVGNVWDDDPYSDKWGAYRKRFPVLQFDDATNVVRTGYITDIIDAKTSKAVINLDEAEKAAEEAAKQLANIRNINIVFVIDAGSGMTEYLASVTDAMRRVMDRHKEEPLNVIKYGVVVYRDYADKDCGEDLSFARKELTPNSSEVFAFVNAQAAKQGCKMGNKAVNKGLYEALRMLYHGKESRDQSNFVVLLGGATGKDENDPRYSDDSIAKNMADVKANFCAFQVVAGNSDEFSRFTLRYSNIMRVAGDKSFLARQASQAHTTTVKPKFSVAGTNTYFLDYPATTDLQAIVMFAPLGSSLASDDMSRYMDSVFRFAESDIERKINALSTKFGGMGLKDIKIDPSIERYFISLGEKLNNPLLIKKFAGKNYQFFVPGYTSMNSGSLMYPVYKRVLFVSKDEFDDLLDALRKVQIESSNLNDVRKKIYNVYLALLGAYMGDKKARAAIDGNRMTIEDVFYYVTGLRSSNDLLKYKVRDFENAKIIPDDKVRDLQDYLAKKYQGLSQLQVDNDVQLKQDWGVFYWVSENYLP
jgi:hypothetical protein